MFSFFLLSTVCSDCCPKFKTDDTSLLLSHQRGISMVKGIRVVNFFFLPAKLRCLKQQIRFRSQTFFPSHSNLSVSFFWGIKEPGPSPSRFPTPPGEAPKQKKVSFWDSFFFWLNRQAILSQCDLLPAKSSFFKQHLIGFHQRGRVR